jgi:HK97 family phage portal protein
MAWWARLRGWTRRALEKTFVENPAQWLIEMFGGGRSGATGVTVTPATSLQCTAVFACVRVVSEGVASLPLKVYRRLEGGGKAPATEHPLYPILHDSPNPEQTSFEFREMLQAHLELRGNAYAEIVRGRGNQILELWPLHPDGIRIERRPSGLVYFVKVPGQLAKQQGREEVPLAADRVLHLRGLSSDGVMGLSPIQVASEAIGLAIAVEEYGARFFGNGAQPGGVIEMPGTLGDEATKKFKASWAEAHQGLTTAHRVAILEGGMTWKQIGLQNEHAQFLETRKYQVAEIARIFRVQLHKIMDLEHATFSNIEHQAIEHVVDTIRPRCVRNEQAMNLKLLAPNERGQYFVEHLLDALLRGDTATRTQALQLQFINGALTLDEWREIENRNPLPDGLGRTHFVPLNLVPIERAGEVTPPAADPAPESAMIPGDGEPAERMLSLFLSGSATRATRREVESIRSAAVREASNGEAWRAWVNEFYPRHAAYLSELLHISLDQARQYTEDHRALLLAHGAGIAESWNGAATADLIALASGTLRRP